MTQEKQEQLQQAIQNGKITFFLAKRGYRAVGMCSVAKCDFKSASAAVGVLNDLFVEPVFRKQGIAQTLVKTAQAWSKA